MPCYLVVTVSTTLNMSSRYRLRKALKNLNQRVFKETADYLETFSMRFNFKTGKIEYDPNRSEEVDAVKREYSFVTLEQVAKKRKWSFKNVVRKPKSISLEVKKY